ncbi:hypothetical protein ACJJIP_13825 [Microbulbifer sp. VTAC004]|uniref:hypothetical protein n=1 Tax=Microbulbifer sp. VTAC004 TaxID=3243386 RepID=UPI004039C6D6
MQQPHVVLPFGIKPLPGFDNAPALRQVFHALRYERGGNLFAGADSAAAGLQQALGGLDAGRVIAELSFGFWTSLLDRRYKQVLWPRLLKTAFPEMPRRLRTRNNLSRRFQRICHLRNRIFIMNLSGIGKT